MTHMEMRNVTLRMDAELRSELITLAEKEHLSLTAITLRMIRKGLADVKRTGVI